MKHGFRYFDYLTLELPSICQNMFNISIKREDTAIMGYSMGGYGALKIALSNPHQYSFCGAFASSCLFLAQGFDEMRNHLASPALIDKFGQQLIDDFVAIWGSDLALKPEDNIIDLLDHLEAHEQKPKLFLTCGTKDSFYSDHQAFVMELNKKSVDYKFHDWSENHTFPFFNESLNLALDHLHW